MQSVQHLSAGHGDVERGWAKMRELIGSGPQRARTTPALWLRWALATQFAVIALLATLLMLPRAGTEAYRTLGAPGFAAAAANAVVMFMPGATEQEIRSALRNSGARVVDG